ncbi:MAG: SGNH/GDSL hydrolase family protein [Planctomycetaceae bacterium]
MLFLGNTMIEREQLYAPLETSLAAALPELDLSFRNLGWSGDTVWADSQGIFEAPEKGYEKMLAQVKTINPTVILLGYGGNEAFAGEAGLGKFTEQYRKLINDLKQNSAEPRFIFLSPLPYPEFGKPFPNPDLYNANVKLYAEAIKQLAQSEEALYIDLTNRFMEPVFHESKPGKYFERSMNLTEIGYLAWTDEILHQLGINSVDLSTGIPDSWSDLKAKILYKNELYFHHWRPQNITYLCCSENMSRGTTRLNWRNCSN